MASFWLTLVFIFCFGTSFHSAQEMTYYDIVMNAIQKQQDSKLVNDEQNLVLDLNLKLSKSHLDSVSAWRILHSGAQLMKSQYDQEDSLKACVNSTLDTFMALTEREDWAVRSMYIDSGYCSNQAF